jgi:hypothetical protein
MLKERKVREETIFVALAEEICSAYSILPPMVVNVYVAYIVYRILRVVVIPT